MSRVAELTATLTWMCDADKRCIYVNTAWMAFTGCALETVLADGWREAIHPDDLPRWLEVLDAAFEGHQPYTLEYRLRRHDGEYRRILDSGIPLPAPEGSSAGYVGSIVDVTERKRAEESLRRKESELTEAQRLAGIGSWHWDRGSGTVTRYAVRHSAAPRFAVSLESTPHVLTLTVHDAGSGFNPESERGDRGLGLTSMRERVKLVAGELVIESKPGSGTTVMARVPLQERHA